MGLPFPCSVWVLFACLGPSLQAGPWSSPSLRLPRDGCITGLVESWTFLWSDQMMRLPLSQESPQSLFLPLGCSEFPGNSASGHLIIKHSIYVGRCFQGLLCVSSHLGDLPEVGAIIIPLGSKRRHRQPVTGLHGSHTGRCLNPSRLLLCLLWSVMPPVSLPCLLWEGGLSGAALGKPQDRRRTFPFQPLPYLQLGVFWFQKPLWENESVVPVEGSTSWCGEVGMW